MKGVSNRSQIEIRTFAAILTLFAFCCSIFAAQHTEVDITEPGYPAFKIFNDRDGLPQNTVKSMAFDQRGYLWVGTQDGAAYYNGRRWTVVNMPNRNISNWIDSIIAASDGSLWFGTSGGGVCQLKNGKWTVFDTNSGLPNNFVWDLLETTSENGTPGLWIATDNGLCRFENGKWTVFDKENSGLPHNEVVDLRETVAADGIRTLWVSTHGGLASLQNGHWKTYDESSGLPNKFTYCLLDTKANDGSEVLWVGTDAGLACLRNGSWKIYDTSSGLPGNKVYSLLATETKGGEDILWVGTNNGLARLENGRWKIYNTSSGLPDNLVISLLAAKENNGIEAVLVGTLAGGLVRLVSDRWLAFNTNSGLPDNHVYSFLETISADGDSIYWIGTNNGLARFEKGQWKVYNTSSGLPDNKVNCLLETEDEDGTHSIWVGTYGGLARLKNNRWTVFDTRSGLPDNVVKSLLKTVSSDGAQVIWAGTYGGLGRLEKGQWKIYDVKTGLPDNQVGALIATKSLDGTETIWAGTIGGGLARFENGRWTVIDINSGLPNNFVKGLKVRLSGDGKRTLWVGTLGGVAWLDLDLQGSRWNVISDSTRPALPNNVVYNIGEDAKGQIYLTTNKGVVRLTPRTPTPDDSSMYAIYNFTIEDGLPSNECNGGALMIDGKRRIWVGTVGGAALFDPTNTGEVYTPKPLRIERTLVNDISFNENRSDKQVSPQEYVGPLTASIHDRSLAHNENNIVFEYALLSHFKESETRYRTQLVGIEDRPSEWTTDYKREYPTLPKGDYVFKVWGRDYAGNVSGPILVPFKIEPPVWQTWWAYFLYLIALASIGYFGIRLRERNMRRRNEALELKVKERTAELAEQAEQLRLSEKRALESEGKAIEASRAKSVFLANMNHELRTPLNAIIGFSQIMARKKDLEPENYEHINTIIRSGEHLLGLINDVLSISKIEAGKLTLKEQPFNTRLMLQDLVTIFQARAKAKDLDFIFEIDPALPKQALGDESKLRQVLINLLGNAVKFTTAGRVVLRAQWRDGRAVFEVEDTGYGISEAELLHLFEPFVQTQSGQQSKEGVGLGLHISRNIVRLMGGDITVRSELNKGSLFRFEIELPAVPGIQAEAHSRKVLGLAAGQPVYRILVADDRWENRAVLKTLLAPLGFNVREAADGKEAVEIWRQWQPHLIWMDMRMKVMDGYSATRQIRSEHNESGNGVVIIALTASTFEQDHKQIRAAGCDDIVTKPFLESTIFEKLEEHLKANFRYEVSPSAVVSDDARSAVANLDMPARLKVVPADLLKQLRRAILQGSPAVTLQAIDEIGKLDEPLAVELRQMVKAYRLHELILLLEKL